MVPPAKKLEDLIHLAELCVDLLQQNDEHYAEVINFYLIHVIASYIVSVLLYPFSQSKY